MRFDITDAKNPSSMSSIGQTYLFLSICKVYEGAQMLRTTGGCYRVKVHV